jgi:hypothetical protein
MTTKSEFAAALMAEDRQRRIEPPAAEEVLAYTRGELPPEKAASVRERLIAHPDLVRTLTAQFPEAAEPGDADYLSDDEFAGRWAALQKRRKHSNGGRVLQFWRAFGAIAAMLAIVFGAMLWRERTDSTKPHLLVEQVLLPDGQRGGGDVATEVTAQGGFFLLVPFVGDSAADSFRADIVAANPGTPIWTSDAVRRNPDGSVMIVVPRKFFRPGRYQVRLYAVTGARQEPLSTYTIRVSEH